MNLRHTTKTLCPPSTETAVKVLCRIRAQAVPAIVTDTLSFALGLCDFFLELRGSGVDELELCELGVEDADDLG